MDYSYEEFLEDIGMGREVEFLYKGIKYYIGGNHGEKGTIMFWKSHDKESEIECNTIEKLLQKVKSDGYPLLKPIYIQKRKVKKKGHLQKVVCICQLKIPPLNH